MGLHPHGGIGRLTTELLSSTPSPVSVTPEPSSNREPRPAPGSFPNTPRPHPTLGAPPLQVPAPPSHDPGHEKILQAQSAKAMQTQADYQRRNVKSLSHYYDPALPENDSFVAWLRLGLEGPYAMGKHDRLTKFDTVLVDASAEAFLNWYHSLRSQLSATMFHPDLLPNLPYVDPNLDLCCSHLLEKSMEAVVTHKSSGIKSIIDLAEVS
jgi:hypothetical protein